MKNNFLEHRPGLRKLIRLAEIAVVVVLGTYAVLTYRELKSLRAVPVILPAYWFYVAAVADEVQRVQARGSWISKESSPTVLASVSVPLCSSVCRRTSASPRPVLCCLRV